ncbi:GyrI-like domain-containing protein [Actinoplanes sp. NPDC051411]|jgi:effector-binding domain-containing protein|uniref:GyrI-like domain-containing protein n=1 Tax=Actinoplanes sp. NPDC051411 TaxID=3155522 RepID=UPI003416A1A7
MEIISGPSVVTHAGRPGLGLRTVTPFRGMFAVRDELMASLFGWFEERGLTAGTVYFRLHVIDMDGPMDIEVGILTGEPHPGDGTVRPTVLPAGRYASLVYVNHGRRATGTLLDWAAASGLRLDRSDDPAGDRFGCRYEAYLTDPRSERMKTKWQTELAIRLAD